MTRHRAFLLLASLLTTGCDVESSASASEDSSEIVRSPEALAVVNGREITEFDVQLSVPGGGARPLGTDMARRRGLLEGVIREDLAAQRAEELGLQLGENDQRQLRQLEAAARSFRRSRMAALYEERARSELTVADEDARAYFEENRARIRSEIHVLQLLVRREAQAQEAFAQLRGGASFDEVARGLLPEPAAESRPWDVGFLRWNQVPPAWNDALAELEPGQTSEIVRGPRNRFWIVQLVERRTSEQITFESERATIVEILRAERVVESRARMTRELREGAHIEYIDAPLTNPHAAEAHEADL